MYSYIRVVDLRQYIIETIKTNIIPHNNRSNIILQYELQ